MKVGELMGLLYSAIGRGEITMTTEINVEAANDETFPIDNIDTDKDGDEVSITLSS